MRVLVASFQYEACSFSGDLPTEADFEYFSGEGIFSKLAVKPLFESRGIEIVPAIYANALPGGVLPLDLYEKYKGQILETARQSAAVDGIFIYFHGSMEVEGVGSGELRLLKELRQIVGEKPLISLCLDLHANITKELVNYADIICGYKTAPHIDQMQTQIRAANALIHCLENKVRPVSKIVPIPMLPMGDAMLTALEPLKSLISKTTELEKQAGILSVNLFFGHMWVDAENTHASVIVTALSESQAAETAAEVAVKFWKTRHKYKLRVDNGSVEYCVKNALSEKGKRVFITDSGDNTTAGAEGTSMSILEGFLREDTGGKRICVAGITNKAIVQDYRFFNMGESFYLLIGDVSYKCVLKTRGKILGWAKEVIGDSITVTIRDNIDVIFVEKRSAFISEQNFTVAGEKITDYDIVVVKLGYLFEELLPFCGKHYFALTDGSSCVDIKRHNYKRLERPMFPLDEDAEFYLEEK